MAYVQHTEEDIERMLARVGARSLEELFRSIPESCRLRRPLALPPRRSESRILADFARLAQRNRGVDELPSFLGGGVYHHFIPAAVDYLSSRGEFNTAYTPYQPEVSQGTLQAIFEYQSMIARLTGMEISNASMYEGGSALAEAVLMAYAVHGKGTRALLSSAVHPEYRRVLESYVRNHPLATESIALAADGRSHFSALERAAGAEGSVFAVVIQNPSFFGTIEDGVALRRALDRFAEPKPLLIVVHDPIALALLKPPGEYGADIVIGDGQGLGNEIQLGGPSFAFFATRLEHVRKVPGRIVGQTRDLEGKRGYVLTFQTREQHIRRERATSNICTNQGLCCLRGAMYLSLLGEAGLRRVAELSTRMAHHAQRTLGALPGVRPVFSAPFFQEFALELPIAADEAYSRLLAAGVRGGLPLGRYFPERERQMLFAVTELTTLEDVALLRERLGEVLQAGRAPPSPAAAASAPRARSASKTPSRESLSR